MEGLYRTYSAPIRRTLRRETRSIAEWREKGKYQPFDLAIAVHESAERAAAAAATWHGPTHKPSWPSGDHQPQARTHRQNPTKKSASTSRSRPQQQDYFSAVPRSTTITTTTTTTMTTSPKPARTERELFAEEPLAADISEAELRSSRRRSIEAERQPLDTPRGEDDVLVDSIIRHLADPTLDAPPTPDSVPAPAPAPAPAATAATAATAAPAAPATKPVVKIAETTVHPAEPPSPEDIIELSAPAKPRPTLSTRDKLQKARKKLFVVDMFMKCIPPAPLPEDLIEGLCAPPPKPQKASPPPAPKQEIVAPPKQPTVVTKELGGVTFEVIEKIVHLPAPVVQKVVAEDKEKTEDKKEEEEEVVVVVEKKEVVKEVVKEVAKEEEEKAEEKEDEDEKKEKKVEDKAAEAPAIVVEEAPAPKAPAQGPTEPPAGHSPGSPQSVVRSDEGYLSGDSDSESDYGVTLQPNNLFQQETTSPANSSANSDAPLPEDIIASNHPKPAAVAAGSEPYQHHCLLHGHFFPRAGPLRSATPGQPFTPLISCDRCQRPRLSEAWQCSLLNQCGIVVCTPCHDELDPPAPAATETTTIETQELILDAQAAGAKKGLEIGLQRGLKIGFEVGLAGKAKEVAERQEREAARRRAEMDAQAEADADAQASLQTYRSWEAVPKQTRRMLSMGL